MLFRSLSAEGISESDTPELVLREGVDAARVILVRPAPKAPVIPAPEAPFIVPFPRNPDFVGRDSDLARLRALMASARVVSIVGAGGLGKTRLAHSLARDAAQPVVHFVELAGVTAAEDVAVEVGSVLGVRDSVSGRRALTPEQRADIRARIAQRLAQSPSLLEIGERRGGKEC